MCGFFHSEILTDSPTNDLILKTERGEIYSSLLPRSSSIYFAHLISGVAVKWPTVPVTDSSNEIPYLWTFKTGVLVRRLLIFRHLSHLDGHYWIHFDKCYQSPQGFKWYLECLPERQSGTRARHRLDIMRTSLLLPILEHIYKPSRVAPLGRSCDLLLHPHPTTQQLAKHGCSASR